MNCLITTVNNHKVRSCVSCVVCACAFLSGSLTVRSLRLLHRTIRT
jgi:hypothetical protein